MKLETVLVISLVCVAFVQCKAVDKDCALESLVTLDFYNFLEKSKECKDETRKVFETKYINNIFEVEGVLVENEKLAINQIHGKKVITVKNVKVIKNILDTFGDLIHNFGIDFKDIDVAKGYEIVEHVNSLKKLESFTSLAFRNCKGNVLDEWKNKFPNVVNFEFSSSLKEKLKIKSDNTKFYQLLPKLTLLELYQTRDSDWTLIGDQFSELKAFEVELPKLKYQDRPNGTHILELLKNSKKVEHLGIINTNLKLLKEVNDILPELKNLTINSLSTFYSDDQIDSVEFKNVKFLEILTLEDPVPEKIYFNALEDISLYVEPVTDKWFEFISKQIKNDGVISFSLESEIISNENLSKIAEHLPHLEKIIIMSDSEFRANDVVDFVEKNKALKSLTMSINMNEAEQNILAQIFDENWMVKVGSLDSRIGIIIIRKNNTDIGDGDESGTGTGTLATYSTPLLLLSLIVTFTETMEKVF